MSKLPSHDKRGRYIARSKPDRMQARIVASDAFRALNFRIDELAEQLDSDLTLLRDHIREAFADAPTHRGIGIRTSYEPDGGIERELLANPTRILQILRMAEVGISHRTDEIRQLQLLKLRLLNDYDFTHGDLTAQKSVFGKHATVTQDKRADD